MWYLNCTCNRIIKKIYNLEWVLGGFEFFFSHKLKCDLIEIAFKLNTYLKAIFYHLDGSFILYTSNSDVFSKSKFLQLVFIVSTAFITSTSTQTIAAPNTFTIGKSIAFEDGNQSVRKGLSKYPELAEIVEGRFSIANADFNDDGRVEIILMGADSNFCGSGGCQTYVVEILPSKKIKILLSQYFGGSLAMTNEKVNGYRALASVSEGKIEIANKTMPMHAELLGKQVVYPMK